MSNPQIQVCWWHWPDFLPAAPDGSRQPPPLGSGLGMSLRNDRCWNAWRQGCIFISSTILSHCIKAIRSMIFWHVLWSKNPFITWHHLWKQCIREEGNCPSCLIIKKKKKKAQGWDKSKVCQLQYIPTDMCLEVPRKKYVSIGKNAV